MPIGDAGFSSGNRLLSVAGATATLAIGFPPGDVAFRGECPSCGKEPRITLSGDLYKHKCISVEASGAQQPVSGTLSPIPVESVIIRGPGWRAIFENSKWHEGWIVNDGVWEKADAATTKQRAFGTAL